MPPSAGAANDAGRGLLEDLARRPPAEVAAWALDQAQQLSRPGVDVQRSQLFQLAGALAAAPPEHAQSLVRNAVAGFGELPPARRAEALRLWMQAAPLVQQAGGPAALARDPAAVARNLAAAAQPGGHAAGAPGPAEREPASMPPSAAPLSSTGRLHQEPRVPPPRSRGPPPGPPPVPPPAADVPIVANLALLVEAARLQDLPRQELQAMARGAQEGAERLAAKPEQMLEVVQELRPDEREHITKQLVDSHVIPEEQRAVFEDAVRPGGYIDKFAQLQQLADWLEQHSFVLPLAIVVECLLSLLVGILPCAQPLAGWLQFDASLGLLAICASLTMRSQLRLAYEALRADPVGVMRRWGDTSPGLDLISRLAAAVPGVGPEAYQVGAIAAAALSILLVIGAIWAVAGILELFAAGAVGCAGSLTFVVVCLFVFLKIACYAAVAFGALYVAAEVRRHMGQSGGHAGDDQWGTSQIPMVDDALPLSGAGRPREF